MNKTDQQLFEEISKYIESYKDTLTYSREFNDKNEMILSSFDFSVNITQAANFNFPEMGKGIFRCILARNKKDWLNYA